MSLCDPRSTLLALLAGLTFVVGCQQSSGPTSAGSSSSEQAESGTATAEESPTQTAATPAAQDDQLQDEPAKASEAPAPAGEESPSENAQAAKSDEAPAPTEVASAEPVPAAATLNAKPPATVDITFDDIKFDIKPDAPFKREMLTKKIEDLAGKPVRIRGYILPSFQQTGLTQFVLVRDNQACCFGPGAALYDCIVVEMKPGKSTDFNLYPVAVEGTFSIQVLDDPDGKALAIYHLDGEAVR
jgi:hypothetical protein